MLSPSWEVSACLEKSLLLVSGYAMHSTILKWDQHLGGTIICHFNRVWLISSKLYERMGVCQLLLTIVVLVVMSLVPYTSFRSWLFLHLLVEQKFEFLATSEISKISQNFSTLLVILGDVWKKMSQIGQLFTTYKIMSHHKEKRKGYTLITKCHNEKIDRLM